MSTAGTGSQGGGSVSSGKHPDLIPREFLRVIAVWSIVPAYLVAGAFLGWVFDKIFHTFPFGLGVGLLLALVWAVHDVIRLRDTL